MEMGSTMYADPVSGPAAAAGEDREHDFRSFLVYLDSIQVDFDGFLALDISSFGVREDELRVIIGPNGAGKTTLCDVISGKTLPSSGRVFFDGNDITTMPDDEIARLGVGRKFQTPTVFDSLTGFENMELSLPGKKGSWRSLLSRQSTESRDHIMSLLERVRLVTQTEKQARHLSHGQRQWLEISMLILANPRLLLIDEPAAGLTDEETALTAELFLELSTSHSMIVIEHDMSFVRRLNAPVTVLNEGKVMAEGMIDSVQKDPAVVEAYLGR